MYSIGVVGQRNRYSIALNTQRDIGPQTVFDRVRYGRKLIGTLATHFPLSAQE